MQKILLKKFLLTKVLISTVILNISCNEDIKVSDCENISGFTINENKINNKVLLIGIDGLRSDVLNKENSPFLYNLSISKFTYVNYNHIVERPTISGPNWSSILTGTRVDKHNVSNNNFSDNSLTVYPSIFHYIEKRAPYLKTSSIVNWSPINKYIAIDADYREMKEINDLEVYNIAKENITSSSSDVMFLQFDELDIAGHNFGFSKNSNEYCNTLKMIDNYILNLHTLIENKRKLDENWMFIVVSDHGGDGISHSESENIHVNRTVLILENPHLKFRTTYISSMSDIATTIFDFIGIEDNSFNCKKDGISLIKK